MEVVVIKSKRIDGEDKQDSVEDMFEKVNTTLMATPTEKVWFVHGPLFEDGDVLKQQLMKRLPEFATTVEHLLKKKSTTLDGIKGTAEGIMSILLRAFPYLLLPVAAIGITIVVIGESVAEAASDFEMHWPSGDVFSVDASWLAPDVGALTWPTMEGVHVFIDGVAFPRLDGVTLPRFDGVTLPRLDGVTLPRLDGVTLPTFDGVTLPTFDGVTLPTFDGVTLPTFDGTLIYYGGHFFRVPDDRVEELRTMVTTERARVEDVRAEAAAVHAAVRGSVYGMPSWLTSINYSSLAATSAKMVLILIAGPITFLLATAATLSGTSLMTAALVIQPLVVCINLLIDTYSGIYRSDQFPRYYKEKIKKVWDNYKEIMGEIPESVYDNVKSMVAAIS